MTKEDTQKLTEEQQIAKDWKTFSSTLAYKKLMEYIEVQKATFNIIASGPLEVGTISDNDGVKLDFEPEKYAYLLQRGVGCDIVKIYVEGYTQHVVKK